jgi:hypothetical protein
MDQAELSISGEPAAPHHVGVAIRAMILSGLLGGAVGTLLLWGVRSLQPLIPPPEGQRAALPIFTLLIASLLGTPAIASLGTWILTRPLTSPWRRGGFAAVAGGMALVVVLIAAVADNIGGRAGLLAYAGLCVVGCALLSRKVAAGFRGE